MTEAVQVEADAGQGTLVETQALEAAHERPTVAGVVLTILLGLAVLVALIPFLQWVDFAADYNPFEFSAPPAGAVGLLVGLLLVNLVVFAVARVRAFRRWQVVVLYVMLMTGLPVANTGLVRPVFTNVTAVASEYVNRGVRSPAPAYAAQDPAFYPKVVFGAGLTPEQRADQGRPLKRFWAGTPLGLAEQFRLKDATIRQRFLYAWDTIPWRIWTKPLLAWGTFIFLCFLAILFLVEVLRQQWVERENLAFPLAVLPSALIDETTGQGRLRHRLLASPLLWLGVAVPVVLLALSGLKHYEKGHLTFGELMVNFNTVFTAPPWDAIQKNIFVVSPLLIGVGYLVHLEVSRSIWIFFLLGAAYMLLAVNVGWNMVERPPEPLDWDAPPYPFPRDQAMGAMIALAALLLWRSRAGLWGLLKAPFSRFGAKASGGPGFMPKRLAAWGFIICFVLLALTMGAMFRLPPGFPPPDLDVTGRIGSVNWALIIGWLVVFFLMVVALARLRAEAGVPNNFLVPSMVRMPRVWGGPPVWGWQSNNAINQFAWMPLSSLPAMAPLGLEGLALARRHGPSPRVLGLACALAFVVALVGGGLCFLWNCYVQGEGYIGNESISHGTLPVWVFYRARGKNLEVGYFHKAQAIAMVVGLVLMTGLMVARSKWLRFPLHPLGYLIWCVVPAHGAFMQHATVKWVHLLWAPMFIAWLIKRTVIRYGGMRLYQRLLPFFLGLILGQLLMLVFWTLVHPLVTEMYVPGKEILLSPPNPREVYAPEAY